MKKLIYPLFLLLIVGCNNSSKVKINSPQKGASEEEMIKNELTTGVRNDTIVLNYMFGMTKNQFRKHTFNLRDQKKITIHDNGVSFLINDCEGNEYKSEILPDFYKDSLYSMILLIDPKRNKSLTLVNLYMLYMTKYHQSDIEIIPAEDQKCREFIWIDGNRKVKLYCRNSKVMIEYIDMRLSKKAKYEKKKKRKQKTKTTKSDI